MADLRRRGMDHTLYPYSALPGRRPFRLPGDRSVAVYVVLQLEYWELLQPEDAYRDPRVRGNFGSFDPDYRMWSYRAYGNRVGLYRILEIFDQMAIPVTAAVGAGVIEECPEIVGEVAGRQFEVVAHGLTANRMITSRMCEETERAYIAESRDAITGAFGVQPRGWLGQDFGTTPRTSRLLIEAGFTYSMDWANDEQPYWQEGGRGIVAIPAPSEWDDVETLLHRKISVERFPRMVCDALDKLEQSEPSSARAMAIGVHPWMFGAPHRSKYLRQTLEDVVRRHSVCLLTAGELADLYRLQSP